MTGTAGIAAVTAAMTNGTSMTAAIVMTGMTGTIVTGTDSPDFVPLMESPAVRPGIFRCTGTKT
jgi:hypothetical protein